MFGPFLVEHALRHAPGACRRIKEFAQSCRRFIRGNATLNKYLPILQESRTKEAAGHYHVASRRPFCPKKGTHRRVERLPRPCQAAACRSSNDQRGKADDDSPP